MPAAQLLRPDEVPAGRAQVLFQLGHGRRQGDQALPGLAQLQVLPLQQLLQLLRLARVILQGQRATSPASPAQPKTSHAPTHQAGGPRFQSSLQTTTAALAPLCVS